MAKKANKANKATRAAPRATLSTEKVLAAAVARADAGGVDALSMRQLAQELDVVPMALYKHVANKDELLDAMIDVVVAEIEPVADDLPWKAAMRRRILSARAALLRHPWAAPVIESREAPTPAVLAYMDAMIGLFRRGGFSIDLTHHAMHAMGSRLLGFSQELFDDSVDLDPAVVPAMLEAMSGYPHITAVLESITHDEGTVVGTGCDDQFEFALDLLLDGLERLHDGPR